MATTSFCTSAKVELLQGVHCFQATKTPTGDTTNASFNITNLSSIAGLVVGMPMSGTNIPASTVLARFLSATSVEMSKAATGSVATTAITFLGDVFKILLIKVAPTRTFDATQTNIGTPGSGAPTAVNVGTDEVSGTGYTTGGFTLTNVDPSNPSGTTATTSFSVNPSWSSASFSTTAAIIYGASNIMANTTGRTISVHDFGGTQTVTAGTLTLVLPTNDAANALLRIA